MRALLPFLLLFTALSPARAEVARTYADALKRAGHKPAVLFCYGANYDETGMRFRQALAENSQLRALQHRCIFLEVPIYQLPDEKQKKEIKAIMGERELPWGIFSFPSLAVIDAEGNLRGVVQKAEEMETPDKAIAALLPMIDAYEKQEKILHKVNTASGPRRSRLLIEASDIRGIEMPPDSVERGKRNPSKDKAGFEKRAAFNSVIFVRELFAVKPEEREAYVNEMLNTPGYSIRQRQEILAAYAGVLRRAAMAKTREPGANTQEEAYKLRELYTKMRDLDPESVYGAYAAEALELWVLPIENNIGR